MKSARRVVITGLGIVSSIGLGKSAYCAALRKGQSGCGPITRFNTSHFDFRLAHEVRNFHFSAAKTLDRVSQYAMAAADEAAADAQIDIKSLDPFRFAVTTSSSKGGMETMDDLFQAVGKPYFHGRAGNLFKNIFCDRQALDIAGRFGARGPVKSWIAACATGNLALSDAYYLLSAGDADYALAGASDASIVPVLLAGYNNMKVLAHDRMRPFDKERGGFLVGEGSGIFFLETLDSARARGARIYAEIAGIGLGQETSHALFFSDAEAVLSRTIGSALKNAGETAASIDYVNLHGTATKHGDIYETREIKKAFGAHAQSLATSSIKPMTGHMLGASGAAEIAATLLAMENSFVPPTIGLSDPDPECDLNYTAGAAAERKIRAAISISMGFGGQTAAVLLRKI